MWDANIDKLMGSLILHFLLRQNSHWLTESDLKMLLIDLSIELYCSALGNSTDFYKNRQKMGVVFACAFLKKKNANAYVIIKT